MLSLVKLEVSDTNHDHGFGIEFKRIVAAVDSDHLVLLVPGANKEYIANWVVNVCNSHDALILELENLLEWALVEQAPLREQEIKSIRRVLAASKNESVQESNPNARDSMNKETIKRKEEQIKEILADSAYLPESGVYKAAAKSLSSLSLRQIGHIWAVVICKNPKTPA